MQTIATQQLNTIWGGGELDLPTDGDPWGRSDDAQTTGKCGLGPYSYGYTKECKAHDDCVQTWDNRISQFGVPGRPAADAVCAPKLPAAAYSALKCAVDPTCPK